MFSCKKQKVVKFEWITSDNEVRDELSSSANGIGDVPLSKIESPEKNNMETSNFMLFETHSQSYISER